MFLFRFCNLRILNKWHQNYNILIYKTKLERILFKLLFITGISWCVPGFVFFILLSGLRIPNIEIRRHTLRLPFLVTGWRERRILKERCKGMLVRFENSVLRSGMSRHLPRNEYSSYCECRNVLRIFSYQERYRVLVRGAMRDYLIEVLGSTRSCIASYRSWAPGLKCCKNNEASLIWLLIRGVFWVGNTKRSFVVWLIVSPECVCYGESIEHAILYYNTSSYARCACLFKATWFACLSKDKPICRNMASSLDKNNISLLILLRWHQ